MKFGGLCMELEILVLSEPNIKCFHSYTESRSKMIKTAIIMGLECKRQLLGEGEVQ
jgi:hypothetical protein